MRKIISFLRQINVVKTLYFNFKAFSFINALKFPVLCFNNVSIKGIKRGGVKCLPVFGSVKIGAIQLGFAECKRPITKVVFCGNVTFKGSASIGSGSYVDCARDASLSFGENFRATGFTTILCSKEINFGHNNLVSWDTLIMDSDAHSIYLLDDISKPINPSQSIKFGDNVWIGARATILKGVTIEQSTVIASCSCISKNVAANVIVASNKQTEIKNNVIWDGRNPN